MTDVVRLADWLHRKLEVEFSQGDLLDAFAAEERASGQSAPVEPREGVCMTSALYWIKRYRKEALRRGLRTREARLVTLKELSERQSRKQKRDMLVAWHDEANESVQATRNFMEAVPGELHRKSEKQSAIRAALLASVKQATALQAAAGNANQQSGEDGERSLAQIREASKEVLGLKAKFAKGQVKLDRLVADADQVADDSLLRVGATSIPRPYVAIATELGLTFIDGWEGDCTFSRGGADIGALMRRGGYYLLSLGRRGAAGHTLSAFVLPAPYSELHLFDPNLGTFRCPLPEGSALIRHLISSYVDKELNTPLFSRWSLCRMGHRS